MSQQTLNGISAEANKDVIELQERIDAFKEGKIPEERFKAFRLTRGVYGQRQSGVQMFRLKIPYGKLTSDQLIRIADISDRYSNGNLHATTRQNIQLHYVKLDDSPQVWKELEEKGVTSREACGNTVRNITASANSGIDPNEPFDVAPYVQATFEYFLRNPICQDMGRKVKIAFSSSESDSAFTYIHDFGLIPRIQGGKRGFKLVLAGGLGAQAMIAKPVTEFLPENELLPFIEAALRVFDRYGEREKREKARMKFLIDEKRGLGIAKFLELVEIERKSLKQQQITIETEKESVNVPKLESLDTEVADKDKYDLWLKTNVFEQKQKGFFGVQVKLELGNITSDKARAFSEIVKKYLADDIRITVNQGFVLRYATKEILPSLFNELDNLGLAEPGFDSTADITACPGTDTCNLGVTNSTAISLELERLIRDEFPELLEDQNIKIKISGCMNSCGQHMIANIGFHGSSIKNGERVIPALQVVMGGGVDPEGKGFIAEKVIKLPTKRIPDALRVTLKEYQKNATEGEYFNDYFQRTGRRYFYDLLKPLADTTTLKEVDYIDWGHDDNYIQEIGVGECASVSYDMIGTIIGDAQERLGWAQEALLENQYGDSIYNSYSSLVIAAKALLLGKDIRCNTHQKIIDTFEQEFIESNEFSLEGSYKDTVLQINKNKPSEEFANKYFAEAKGFLEKLNGFREKRSGENGLQLEKLVVGDFYKA
ncbi:MAG: nitrite reductase [Bacteroidota bacterium]